MGHKPQVVTLSLPCSRTRGGNTAINDTNDLVSTVATALGEKSVMIGEIGEEISGITSIAVSLQTDGGKVDEQSSEFVALFKELEGIADQFEL